MALCSFGGVSDQCGATSWAVHKTGMVLLLSCEIDMTEWLKEKYKGSGTSGVRGRPSHTKATGDSNHQLGIIHAHKWLLSQSSGLLLLRETTIFYDFVVSNCLFVTKISRGNLLGSCEEKLTFNKLSIERAKGLTKILTLKGKKVVILSQQSREPKTAIRITLRLLFVCSLCLFTFSFTCADAYHAITIQA